MPSRMESRSVDTSAALAPKHGGTLRISCPPIGGNIGWPATQAFSGYMVQAYYETLLRSDEKGNLIPWLAESYKVGDDLRSITLTLRKGIKFSDGSDLTADVVKWNLEQRLKSLPDADIGEFDLQQERLHRAAWASIEAVDPNTVRINLKTWDNAIPASFGDAGEPALFMVSKAAYDKNGQDWMTGHPVGTGPFTVESHTINASAKLVKNPNYWAKDAEGRKLPYLDGLDFTFAFDPEATFMMAQAGEIDMVLALSLGKQLADYRNAGWCTNAMYDSNEVWIPDSANQDSPWSKQEVREAAEYAVDRATIAENFGYGYLQAPNQIPPRDSIAYNPNCALARNYDPAKAKELLAQARYLNGFETKLIIWPGGNREVAFAEQQYLAAVGIQAEIEFSDMGKWSSYTGANGKCHNAILEGPDQAGGPTGLGCVKFALGLFGNNWQKPANFTAAYAAAISSPAPDVSLIRATTDILAENALMIPIWEVGGGRAERPYVVADFGNRALPAFISLETAWLNK